MEEFRLDGLTVKEHLLILAEEGNRKFTEGLHPGDFTRGWNMCWAFVCRRCGNWLQGLPRQTGSATLIQPTGSTWKNACCKAWC